LSPRLETLKKSGPFRLGLGMVLALVVFSVVAPWLSPHDATTSEFERAVGPDGPVGPCLAFPLGADRLYRDVLVRLAIGGRISLGIGVAATAIATVLGTIVGVVSGYFEGSRGARIPYGVAVVVLGFTATFVYGPEGFSRLMSSHHGLPVVLSFAALAALVYGLRERPGFDVGLDTVLMRVVDVGLAFPFLLLVLAIGSVFERTSATTILLTLGLSGWLGIARVVRAKTIAVKGQEFVHAARALGQSTPRILALHILPNVSGPVVVLSTLSVAQMIVAESALGFLGVGISPPTPTWGYMLFEGQDVLQHAPWLVAAPFATILLAVLGFNVLGEGLREALDPRKAKR
jgi:ABC-type dipeptide/oligopeptide/nickel transport system permease subunit